MPITPSRRLDFAEVPVVDLGPLREGADCRDTVAAIASACTDVGFFYVRNHDVPRSLIDRLRAEAEQFFALPMAEKQRLGLDPTMRGYLPLYYRSYENEARAGRSHQEGFWVGREIEGEGAVLDEIKGRYDEIFKVYIE